MKDMKKLSLDELRRKEAQQAEMLRSTREQIEDQENAELLPVLRLKYEKKYFRYKNSSEPDCSWSLYVYCRQVTNSRFQMAIVDSFEVAPHGCEFKTGADGGEFLFETQITKDEWDRALRAFKARVGLLGVTP